jgi:hypothetical protein
LVVIAITIADTNLALAQSAPFAQQGFPSSIAIAGTPRDRGRSYGILFRESIHEFLATEIETAFLGKHSSKEHLLQYAAACGEVVCAECPMIAEKFHWIADVAGLSFDEIVLINLHEELYHRPFPWTRRARRCGAQDYFGNRIESSNSVSSLLKSSRF